MKKPTFIFIYNAAPGKINGLFDSIHKAVSPQTYACDLCALTHGFAGAHAGWKRFMQHNQHRADFKFIYRKDAAPYRNAVGRTLNLPAVLLRKSDTTELLLEKADFSQFKSLEEFIDYFNTKLNSL